MIISESTLNTAIFVTTVGGFIKTAFADNLVDGVFGGLILTMAGGLSYIASMRYTNRLQSV